MALDQTILQNPPVQGRAQDERMVDSDLDCLKKKMVRAKTRNSGKRRRLLFGVSDGAALVGSAIWYGGAHLDIYQIGNTRASGPRHAEADDTSSTYIDIAKKFMIDRRIHRIVIRFMNPSSRRSSLRLFLQFEDRSTDRSNNLFVRHAWLA